MTMMMKSPKSSFPQSKRNIKENSAYMRFTMKRLLITITITLISICLLSFFLLYDEGYRKEQHRFTMTVSTDNSNDRNSNGNRSSDVQSNSQNVETDAKERRKLPIDTRKQPLHSLYFNNTIPEPDYWHETGSFANCTSQMKTSTNVSQPVSNHPDASKVIISCREIHFRAPLSKIEKGGEPIVVGVLSGAGGEGPMHRDSIRSTWARDSNGVYFIVAGPWEDIEEEYNKYRDLIWIDEEEVYEGEESVLPFKTETFLYIINKYAMTGKAGFQYLFKTDDDSYLDLNGLQEVLLGKSKDDNEPIHYFGCCTNVHYRPLRHPSRKWRITFALYPEEYYPLYCQGAGFAVSRQMTQCITHEENISKFRYNPFEDVSVGLLAERCGYRHTSDCTIIQQYRTKESGEKKQLTKNHISQINLLPKATMKNKILQHRVKTHMDMYAHHKCVIEGC